jgi:hypothetical protein
MPTERTGRGRGSRFSVFVLLVIVMFFSFPLSVLPSPTVDQKGRVKVAMNTLSKSPKTDLDHEPLFVIYKSPSWFCMVTSLAPKV